MFTLFIENISRKLFITCYFVSITCTKMKNVVLILTIFTFFMPATTYWPFCEYLTCFLPIECSYPCSKGYYCNCGCCAPEREYFTYEPVINNKGIYQHILLFYFFQLWPNYYFTKSFYFIYITKTSLGTTNWQREKRICYWFLLHEFD